MTTLFVLGSVAAVLSLSVFFTAWLLLLGARWAKIPDITFRRAALAVLAYSLLGIVAEVIPAGDDDVGLQVIVFLAALVGTWLIIRYAFHCTFGRAVWAWLPTLVYQIVVVALIAFVVKPFVLETYVIPTGAMAPTIAGDHYVAECPRCGGELFVSAADRPPPSGVDLGICTACRRTSEVKIPHQQPTPGDRVLSLKFLPPRRWDAVTFRYPAEPEVLYVMRLVGLPGEEVAIREGAVWIDGRKMPVPPELAGLEYVAWPDGFPVGDTTQWGPATLADDEYFVLGDFSQRSADSRLWGSGAPGHPAYAVPRSYLDGVVTHIYWPPSRWRCFR